MAVKKSVTLDEDVVNAIAAEAGERGFSGWLNDAARARLDREHMLHVLAELDAGHGPVPAELLDTARQAWARRVAPADGPGVTDLPSSLEEPVGVRTTAKRSSPRTPRRRAAG